MDARRSVVRPRTLGALLIVVLAVGGCASASPSKPNDPGEAKAGGEDGPVMIRIADSQEQGKPSNQPLVEFATQVKTLSKGSMAVELDYDVGGEQTDAPVIADLRAGKYEMAVVAARSWSSVEVHSLSAFQAPFLVGSDGLLDQIASDQDISEQLMSGLPAVGVQGLALFPDSVRHLFSFGAPIRTPEDVKGLVVRGPASAETSTAVEALGATFVSPSYDDFVKGAGDGSITAAESSFVGATAEFTQRASAASNLVLYAKATTFVANLQFYTSLTTAQQSIMTRAAAAARQWAVDNRMHEKEAAQGFCDKGSSVFLATDDALASFLEAEQPLYDALRSDATTRTVMADIATIGAADSPETTTCGTPEEPPPAALEPTPGDFPDGTYRLDVTDSVLKKAGVPEHDFGLNRGILTYVMHRGTFQWSVQPPRGPEMQAGAVLEASSGPYAVDGSSIEFQISIVDGAAPPHIASMTYTVNPDGSVQFHFPSDSGSPYDRAVFTPLWTRIGD